MAPVKLPKRAPSGDAQGIPAGVPGFSCRKTDRQGHFCRDTGRVSHGQMDYNCNKKKNNTPTSMKITGYDWTTRRLCDGNEWRKYRAVSRAHPLRSCVSAYFKISLEAKGGLR